MTKILISDINSDRLEKLGDELSADDAITGLLSLHDDVHHCLYGHSPNTPELKKLLERRSILNSSEFDELVNNVCLLATAGSHGSLRESVVKAIGIFISRHATD